MVLLLPPFPTISGLNLNTDWGKGRFSLRILLSGDQPDGGTVWAEKEVHGERNYLFSAWLMPDRAEVERAGW